MIASFAGATSDGLGGAGHSTRRGGDLLRKAGKRGRQRGRRRGGGNVLRRRRLPFFARPPEREQRHQPSRVEHSAMNSASTVGALQRRINVALGSQPADIVLRGGRILNVFTGDLTAAD